MTGSLNNFVKFILLAILLLPIISCSKTEEWIDEALLHDGRVIEVKRTVIYHFGSDYRRWPNEYSLEALNPDTGNRVEWSGEQYVNPIMLDFVNGIPYLAIVSDRVFSNPKKYGCPEIPYAFLKYDDKTSKWMVIPNDAVPNILYQTNLSESYDGWMDEIHKGKRQKYQDIPGRNKNRELGSRGYFSVVIPSNFEEWKYKLKNRFKNTRLANDCRPALPLPVDAINPTPVPQVSRRLNLEVIEQKVYEPNLQINSSDWSVITYDNERSQACKSLLKAADSDNPQLNTWQVFVNDPTGKKITSNRNSNRICESDTIWFIDYVAEKDKTVVIKVNKFGNVIYRISFKNPELEKGFRGAINMPTFKSEKGYIYFEWSIFRDVGQTWEVNKKMKVRFLEPVEH